jgi:hypothetical protein
MWFVAGAPALLDPGFRRDDDLQMANALPVLRHSGASRNPGRVAGRPPQAKVAAKVAAASRRCTGAETAPPPSLRSHLANPHNVKSAVPGT